MPTLQAELTKLQAAVPAEPVQTVAMIDTEVCAVVALARELCRTNKVQSRALLSLVDEVVGSSNMVAAVKRICDDFAQELKSEGYQGVEVRKSNLKKVLTLCAESSDFRALIVTTLASTAKGLQGCYDLALEFARKSAAAMAKAAEADAEPDSLEVATDDEANEPTAADAMLAAIKAAIKVCDDSGRADLVAMLVAAKDAI